MVIGEMGARRFAWVALCVFLSSPFARANAHLWSVDITGGEGTDGTDVDFYQGAKQHYQAVQSFGVSPERNIALFGQANGDVCYSQSNAATNAKITQDRAAFLASPADCSKAAPIYSFMLSNTPRANTCSSATHQLGDFDGNGSNDIAAPATPDKVKAALDRVIGAKGAKVGDHLLFNLNDHGMKQDGAPPTWTVGLGDEGVRISLEEVRGYVDQLQAKGVIVHLDVQACFGGGFNQLTNAAPGKTAVCSTAMADPNIVGYGADALIHSTFDVTYPANLKQYGSQLKAFACSLASDPLNRPNSSLDTVVDSWESSQPAPLPDCAAVTSLTGLAAQVDQFVKVVGNVDSLQKQRTDLIDAYRLEFASVVESCATGREADVQLAKQLQGCVKDSAGGVDPSLQNMLGDFFNHETGERYDVSMINRHLRFLKNANAAKLQEFKTAFCCLTYDLKTGEVPKVCH